MAIALELDELDDALDRLAVAHFLAPNRPQKQHLGKGIGVNARVAPGQEIVEHRHLREQFAVLEGAGKAEPGDLVRLAPRDVTVAKPDLALAVVDAAHAIEHAGLAGAVRTDQRKQLARSKRD